jgi:hypothetical protein
MTVIDGLDDKGERSGGKTVPQHEIDAQATREKMARLRELRLAQQGANGTAAGPATSGKRTGGAKKGTRKSAEKTVSLSAWLTTQQKEGRRN